MKKDLNLEIKVMDHRNIIQSQLNSNRINLGASAPLQSPLVIYMETTTYCNLACKFCPHFISPDEFEKGTMDFLFFKKVCADLLSFTPKVKLLRFCGLGDSLMNKKITKFVDHAVQNKVAERFEMISNGLLLDDKNIPILAKTLDRLIISIEGLNNDQYWEFTNRKIKFDDFCKNLKKFSKVKNKKCKLHIKIHNSAVNSKAKLQKFHALFADIADEIYIENLVNLWPGVISNLGLDSGHRFVNSPRREVKVCPQIFKSMQVNHDGKIMPCCIDWKVENVIGDANTMSLSDIWQGEIIRKLQIKHLNGERHTFQPCATCTLNENSDIDNLDSNAKDILYRVREKYQTLIES